MAEPAPRRSPGLVLPYEVPADPLVLRCYDDADVPALSALVAANLEHLRPWMPWIAPEPLSERDRAFLVEEWRSERAEGKNAVYGIFLDGELVGGTGFHPRIGPGGVEIGYWIAEAHVGRGFATIASRALTDHACTIDGIVRVQIRHDVANTASEGVPQRLGFRHVRDEPREPQAPGETGVMRVWQTTPDEWRATV